MATNDEPITDQFLRLFDEGRFLDALPLIEEIVSRNPSFAVSWLNLGATLARLGRPIDSASAYVRASHLDENRQGHYSACHTLAEAGESQHLLRLLEQECEADRSTLKLFLEAEVLDPYFEKPEFQALVRRFGYH